MASFAVVLIFMQIWYNRPDENEKFKLKILLPDICIMILSGILLVNMFIRISVDSSFHTFYTYGKVGSAILLYILGRLCYKRIDECHFAIVSSSYIIVFANFIYRIITFKGQIFSTFEPNGDLYFYDTDMAFSITMAFIFIAILGRNTIFKFLTIFAICPFMVFHSNANIQKFILCILMFILLMYMFERAVKKRRFTDFILPLSIIFMMVVLVIIVAPIFTGNTDGIVIKYLNDNIIGTDNLLYRYSTWQALWNDLGAGNMLEMLFGKGLTTSFQIENAYLSILYSTGFVGILCAAVFVLSISSAALHIEDRPFYYITIMLAILFLSSCINKNGMEFTQMSWFTMLFFGMSATISANKKANANSDNIDDFDLDTFDLSEFK